MGGQIRSRSSQQGRSVSIRDVAKAAGVSVATVSRALGPNAESTQMKPQTRERVLRASEELGYRPNDLARALRHHQTDVIGLVVPDISNPYYPGLVRGVEDAATAAGYRVVLCNTDRDPEKTAQYLDALVKSRVDGMIIAGGADTSMSARAFAQYRTKTVLVGRHELDHPSVQVDNVHAAEQAMDYLLGLGHRQIAFIGGPSSSNTVRDRLSGYESTLRRHDIAPDLALVHTGDLDEESGYQAARKAFEGSTRTTAVLAANDRIAVGVLAALHDLALSVPSAVSVVGFDNVSMSSYLRPRLTTVAIPTYEIGSSAAKLLFEALGDEEAGTRHIELPTELLVRDSCAPPAG